MTLTVVFTVSCHGSESFKYLLVASCVLLVLFETLAQHRMWIFKKNFHQRNLYELTIIFVYCSPVGVYICCEQDVNSSRYYFYCHYQLIILQKAGSEKGRMGYIL